ncbi:MAG: 30S ribosomal protein S12 methylthiotransferase RimO [Oscillospiraceae bacterium]|jgi:ribosomal protein S12 methylthiotransferase|nr:30S ribosomal protein S12 methylthiotransferase RimO [Oscillospiraceae bacterium]
MKIGLVSLGCAKNQVDAEKMLGSLERAGYEFCSDPGLCDFIVVNTCGFIESAKQESINNILEMCALKGGNNKLKKVIVTGCLAQRYGKEIKANIPEVDVVLGLGANQRIAELIKSSLDHDEGLELFGSPNNFNMEGARYRIFDSPSAHVKVADGCSNRCSYCAIPLLRGSFRSRKQEDILAEARDLVESGVREINLVAQDTTSYGQDIYGTLELPRLLSELSKLEDLKRIRLLYCYPDRITDELLEVMKTTPKVVKYIDVPFQHVNENILREMNRTGNAESLRKLIGKIRERVPRIVFRTTFIVGFPGETGEQFEELCDFVKEIKFERLGCFVYSQEENTKAAKLPGQVAENVKTSRAEKLMAIQASIADEFSKSLVGSIFEVLVEQVYTDGMACGRTYMDAPEVDGSVIFGGNKSKIGNIVKVQIESFEGYELFGSVV